MTTDQSCVDVLPRTRLNKWDNLRFTFEFRQLLHMRKTAYHSFESILPTRTLDLKALLTFYDATFHQQPISEEPNQTTLLGHLAAELLMQNDFQPVLFVYSIRLFHYGWSHIFDELSIPLGPLSMDQNK